MSGVLEPRARIELARASDVADLDVLARGCGLSLDSARELALPQSVLWVLRAEREVMGFALGWVLADELEVVDVGVRSDRRRRGFARSLLQVLLESGRARGAQVAFLEVRAGNSAAQALYTSLGFVRDGERRGYYADGEDAWLFRVALS